MSLVLDSSSLLTFGGGPAGSLGRCHGAPVLGFVCRPNGIRKKLGSRMLVSRQSRGGVARA